MLFFFFFFFPLYSKGVSNAFCLFVYLVFLWPQVQHMEVPRLGVKLELQLPAHTTATAKQNPSRVGDLHCSLQQCQTPHPLNESRDLTHILTDTNWVFFLTTEPQWELPQSVFFREIENQNQQRLSGWMDR